MKKDTTDVEALLLNGKWTSENLLKDQVIEAEDKIIRLAQPRTAAESLNLVTSTTSTAPTTASLLLLLLLWLAISYAVVMSNQYIMRTLEFAHPATLTCWHQAFGAVLLRLTAPMRPRDTLADDARLTLREYAYLALPISALFSLSLMFNNLPYLTLSVAFIQMLKGLGPACALLAMWTLGLQSPDFGTCVNIGIVVTGAAITSFGEVKFALDGFTYQILGLLFDSYRLGLTRKLLSGEKSVKPLDAMEYMALPSAVMLGIIAAVKEWPGMSWKEVEDVGVGLFLVNGAMAFSLNFVVFKVIGRTSPLTLPLCAELKKVIIVLSSVVLLGDTVTSLQLLGYVVTSVGVLLNLVGTANLLSKSKSFFRY